MRKFNQECLVCALSVMLVWIIFNIGDTSASTKIIATVNGKAITEDAVLTEVNRKIPLASYHSQLSEQKLQQFREQALQKLIDEELLYQEARHQRLVVKSDQVDQQIELMKRGYASEKAYQQQLAKTGLTNRSLRKRLERRLLIQQIEQNEIIEKIAVTEADLVEYYNKNKAKFIKPQQYRVRQILISVSPGAMANGWQQGLKNAQQLYSRIIGGEDFAQLAQQLSADSSSRNNGGDIGWFHKGQLLQQLEQALETMQIGEVCQPIRSIYGYHILKYEDSRPEKQLSYDEINLDSLKKRLMKKRIDNRRQQFIASLKAKADIQIYND